MGAALVAVESDRAARTVDLRFVLPPDAGTPEAAFRVFGATHLLAFAYLPPATPLPAEDALAHVGDWARQGLVATLDLATAEAPLVVARAHLHTTEGVATLAVEGYGEDAEVLVWWELRVSGQSLEPLPQG